MVKDIIKFNIYIFNNDLANFQTGVSTIVAAINSKAGSSHASTDAPSTIAATVNNLTLGIVPSGTLEKTTNGTYDCTNYASFKVNVPASAVTSGTLTKSYTTNNTSGDTFDVTSYKSCKVTINVPASAVTSGTLTKTTNGTYDCTSYKNVTISVPTGASSINISHPVFTVQVGQITGSYYVGYSGIVVCIGQCNGYHHEIVIKNGALVIDRNYYQGGQVSGWYANFFSYSGGTITYNTGNHPNEWHYISIIIMN